MRKMRKVFPACIEMRKRFAHFYKWVSYPGSALRGSQINAQNGKMALSKKKKTAKCA